MKAAIYTRFSSDNQTELSTQAQVRACMEYAAANGFDIYKVYSDEAISGTEEKTDQRIQYQAMLADARRKRFDVLLIHKYDRVARSLEEHVRLSKMMEREHIPVVAVAQNFGSSIEGEFAKQMMWVLSEYYSKNLSKEVRKGHKELALKGLHNGGPAPFGFRVVDKRLVIEETEAFYVRKMFEAALNRRGFQPLMKEMREAGVRGRNGSEIKYTQIYEILRNEKYAGIYVYSVEGCRHRKSILTTQNAIRIDGAIPAIVDKNTFYEVQKIMDMRKQNGRKQNEYLCSGLVYCKCGAKMHIHRAPNRKGDKYVYYACSANCGAPTVREEVLVKAVTDYLKELLSDAMQFKIAHFLRSYRNHRKDCRATYTAVVKKQIAAKQTEYDNLVKNLSAATFAPEIIQDLNNRMKALKAEIETLETADPPEEYSTGTILEWLKAISAAPDRRAVHLLVDRIEVSSDKEKTDVNVISTLTSVGELVAAIGFEASLRLAQGRALGCHWHPIHYPARSNPIA